LLFLYLGRFGTMKSRDLALVQNPEKRPNRINDYRTVFL
jgi:hypothetical protein